MLTLTLLGYYNARITCRYDKVSWKKDAQRPMGVSKFERQMQEVAGRSWQMEHNLGHGFQDYLII